MRVVTFTARFLDRRMNVSLGKNVGHVLVTIEANLLRWRLELRRVVGGVRVVTDITVACPDGAVHKGLGKLLAIMALVTQISGASL